MACQLHHQRARSFLPASQATAMAVLQIILAMVFRWMGTILNTLIGWASMLLFGKVVENRQYLLSAITFCSVIWLALILGVAFPRVGTFLLTFVVIPKWVDESYIRLGMLRLTAGLSRTLEDATVAPDQAAARSGGTSM